MKHLILHLLLITLYVLLIVPEIHAQPAIQWQKLLGGTAVDQANHLCQTIDGGFIVAGASGSLDGDLTENIGGLDVWILKMDNTGAIQWQKTFGGSDNEAPGVIRQTRDGGYIVTGSTVSQDEIMSGNHGQMDTWVVKMDSTGIIEWKRIIGGSLNESINDLLLTPDDGFLLVGQSESSDGDVTENQGEADIWLVKLDFIGITQWQKSYGGNDVDRAYSVVNTADGGFLVGGLTVSENWNVDTYHGGGDALLLKLNNTGEMEWMKTYGGSSLESIQDIQVAADGGYITCGYSYSNDGDLSLNHGEADFWAIKFTNTGIIEWQRSLGGSNYDFAVSMVQTPDKGYVLAGHSQSYNGDVFFNHGNQDAWLVKLDSSGNMLWQKPFGGVQKDGCLAIELTADHGFLLAGYSSSDDGTFSGNHGQNDMWVLKLSPETVAVSEHMLQPLTVYPNPASLAIHIEIPSNEGVLNVQLSDMSGNIVRRDLVASGKTLDVSSLPNGFYLMTATTFAGKVYAAKISKVE